MTVTSAAMRLPKLDRPCRIYAPVGTHETLLAYLVRRLLENGANSSFVNRISDPAVSVDELIADPVDVVSAMPVPGTPHDQIELPADLFGKDRVDFLIVAGGKDCRTACSDAERQSLAEFDGLRADGGGTCLVGTGVIVPRCRPR